MHESFLHFLWQMQYFDRRDLRTTEGEPIEVFHTGTPNHDAGPDFANSRVRIGNIDWVGSVEIHIQSSGWLEHRHDRDAAYDNVVLHVVWKHDREITRADAGILPTLELRGRVDESLVRKYRQLVTSSLSIPCQRSLRDVPDINKVSMLGRALLQRLERKAAEVQEQLEQNGNNWEEIFYQWLARSFGFKVNAEPFFQLAKSLPLKTVLKQGTCEQIEALLLGQAGFLDAPRGDEYYMRLRREHSLLSQKYSLRQSKMSRAQWRFMRLRPANFPSLRLAQLGAVLGGGHPLFSRVMESHDVASLYDILAARPSPYWEGHYQFSKKTKMHGHELGKSSIDVIIINTVVPFWVAYGKRLDEQRFVDKALKVLEQLPPEDNRITRMWKDVGFNSQNAFDTQALLELFHNFCQRKCCLDCNIGAFLVRPA